jgi:hypothetical protein
LFFVISTTSLCYLGGLLVDRGFGQNTDDTLTRFRTFIREYEAGTLIPSQGVK